MELTLKNIGKIRDATVEINGITIIAGENNTGKSTVGKVLYSVFNSFYNVEAQIKREKVQSVTRVIDIILFDNPIRIKTTRANSSLIADYIVENYNIANSEENDILSIVLNGIKHYSENYDNDIEKSSILNKSMQMVTDILSVDDNEIFGNVFRSRLDDEFNGQLNNIYSDKVGEINLKIKDTSVLIKTRDQEFLDIGDILDLKTEAIYIDDPFVIDEITTIPIFSRIRQQYDHRNHLKNKLLIDKRDMNAITEIITTNKFDEIFEKIGFDFLSVNSGVRQSVVKAKNNREKKPLNVKNLSTGIKTFLIIKTLLYNGKIEQNGIIILDEPEIHLHPEWQLLFAELIVLIQKEFGMHILLNTHSPYFLRAIEVYAAKYEIADRCKYYLSEIKEENAYITDISDDIEPIYKKLSKPFQDLENERFKYD